MNDIIYSNDSRYPKSKNITPTSILQTINTQKNKFRFRRDRNTTNIVTCELLKLVEIRNIYLIEFTW